MSGLDPLVHGVFAPTNKLRPLIIPVKKRKQRGEEKPDELSELSPPKRRGGMSWAQRLKRVFKIDIETCRECGGRVKIIACIEDALVIEKMMFIGVFTNYNG